MIHLENLTNNNIAVFFSKVAVICNQKNIQNTGNLMFSDFSMKLPFMELTSNLSFLWVVLLIFEKYREFIILYSYF